MMEQGTVDAVESGFGFQASLGTDTTTDPRILGNVFTVRNGAYRSGTGIATDGNLFTGWDSAASGYRGWVLDFTRELEGEIEVDPYVADAGTEYGSTLVGIVRLEDTLDTFWDPEYIEANSAGVWNEDSSDSIWVYLTQSGSYMNASDFQFTYTVDMAGSACTDRAEINVKVNCATVAGSGGTVTLYDFGQNIPLAAFTIQ